MHLRVHSNVVSLLLKSIQAYYTRRAAPPALNTGQAHADDHTIHKSVGNLIMRVVVKYWTIVCL